MGFKKKDVNILVIGLDNSGKSTILNHFKPEEDKSPDIVPTVGFNVEKFKSNEIVVCAFSQCGIYGNLLLHFLKKKFVKSMILLDKEVTRELI